MSHHVVSHYHKKPHSNKELSFFLMEDQFSGDCSDNNTVKITGFIVVLPSAQNFSVLVSSLKNKGL